MFVGLSLKCFWVILDDLNQFLRFLNHISTSYKHISTSFLEPKNRDFWSAVADCPTWIFVRNHVTLTGQPSEAPNCHKNHVWDFEIIKNVFSTPKIT